MKRESVVIGDNDRFMCDREATSSNEIAECERVSSVNQCCMMVGTLTVQSKPGRMAVSVVCPRGAGAGRSQFSAAFLCRLWASSGRYTAQLP